MMWFRSLTVLVLCGVATVARGELAVSNHESGSTVRYPVVLLRGTLDAGAEDVEIRNAQARDREVKAAVLKGAFKALVELVPGRNVIGLRSGGTKKPLLLELNYKPQTNPYYVRLVWMTGQDGDTTFATPKDGDSQDYEARLRTAGLLMQTFTAERMHDLGYGRRTFRLERDAAGQVIVHTLKGPKSKEEYYAMDDQAWWRDVAGWLNDDHSDKFAKNCVLAAYTRKDPDTGKLKAHTALGGGNLGLFGSASVFAWPTSIVEAVTVFSDDTRVDPKRVHDDSAGRGRIWALASTTIGATLHEMGHTFGLPHCQDGLGIMTRGFDKFNRVFTFKDPPSNHRIRGKVFTPEEQAYFAPISASYLKSSRWYQLDETKYVSDSRPKIAIDEKNGKVVVTSDAGVPWVGFWVGSEIVAHREFKDSPKEVTLTLEDIQKQLGEKQLRKISAIAGNGKSRSEKPDSAK